MAAGKEAQTFVSGFRNPSAPLPYGATPLPKPPLDHAITVRVIEGNARHSMRRGLRYESLMRTRRPRAAPSSRKSVPT